MSVGKNHSEKFEQYLRGELSSEEAHDFEREYLDDSFTQEALEGFSDQGLPLLDDLEDLRKRIKEQKKKPPYWRYVGIAATLVLSSYFLFLLSDQLSPQPEQTSNETAPESLAESPLDSASLEIPSEKQSADSMGLMANLTIEDAAETDESSQNEGLIAEILPNELGDEDLQDEDSGELELTDSFSSALVNDNDVNTAISEENDLLAEAPIVPITTKEETFEPGAEGGTESDDDQLLPALQGRVAGVTTKRSKARKKSVVAEAATRSSEAFFVDELVSGQVTDESGEPLPGVNVIIKGTTTATSTDLDGYYQLKKDSGATLTFTYVGFESQEIEVGGRNNLDVVLGGSAELAEVGVTGYAEGQEGTQTFTPATPSEGKKAFKKYVEDNLEYPSDALENDISGTVLLEVSIAADGDIRSILTRKGLGFGCDQEAIRLVREGPEWIPAIRNGINVEDVVKVKIKFKR